MKKTSIIILCCCTVFATTLVLTLYAATRKIVNERYDFLREYAIHAAVQASEMDIEFNSWYIAGITPDRIYFGNVTAPLHILTTNTTLTDSQHVQVSIEGAPTIYKSAVVRITPPDFYIADGRKSVIYKGQLRNWQAKPVTLDSNTYFSQIIPIGNSTFAIRGNSARTGDNILGKIQQADPHMVLNAELLVNQQDGIFSTDGKLLYNALLKELIYTYYYRNEFIVFDTSLNLKYRGHTIDTFSRAQIKIGHIGSDNVNQLMDKKTINQQSCTSGKYLYVKSNVLAKNDIRDRLSRESIIDVYNVQDNTYRFSFTLPHHSEKKLQDFMVFDDKILIALYDHFAVRYDLQPKYFSASRTPL